MTSVLNRDEKNSRIESHAILRQGCFLCLFHASEINVLNRADTHISVAGRGRKDTLQQRDRGGSLCGIREFQNMSQFRQDVENQLLFLIWGIFQNVIQVTELHWEVFPYRFHDFWVIPSIFRLLLFRFSN